MSDPIKFWRYQLEFTRHPDGTRSGDWAIVFVDARGTFLCLSAYGTFGYHWAGHGCRDPREFVADLTRDPEYAMGKLAPLAKGRALHQATAFGKDILPRLAVLIRAELEAEGYFAEGATT